MTDRKALIKIFKRAGIEITVCEDDYIEIQTSSYDQPGFEFDEDGKLVAIV